MNRIACLAICSVLLGISATAQENATNPVDALIDWQNPMAITPEKFAANSGFSIHKGKDSRGDTHFLLTHEENKGLTMANGQIDVISMECVFSGDELKGINFKIGSSEETGTKPEALKALIRFLYKTISPKSRRFDLKIDKVIRGQSIYWSNPRVEALLAESFAQVDGTYQPTGKYLLTLSPPGRAAPSEEPSITPPPSPVAEAPGIGVNLDALLNFATFWQSSPADLEKLYVAKADNEEEQKGPPQFEWLNSTKDRARFSRHMFGDVETKLTLFGESIKVEEAVIEFVNGKAARATLSLYNVGDAHLITVAEFERVFKSVGQNLGQVMKVAPKRQIISSNAALPVTGWMWSTPTGIALLEHNEYAKYNEQAKVRNVIGPDFLRLKLAAPDQADWSMGKLAVGIQRMELIKRVTKSKDGDVYLSGVPMVDQGQKGYCVAASCQRLFEYLRIPCDQHEMAKLVGVSSKSGADVHYMQKSLAKIDGAFKVTFRALVNPEAYYAGNGKRRVSEREFFTLVKESTDKGVPLLWGLVLGEKPEDPPLPNGGQVSGGHMRLIIGYNEAKKQLLFTDSWGAGHELKRMAMVDAYDVTMGLYSMAPRGL